MRAEMELAAPVAEGAAPEPEPVWLAEPEPEPERDAPEAVGLAAPEPVPEAAGEAAAPGIRVPVCDEGKSLAMQLCTQSEYLLDSSVDPSPWSHFAAHSLVSTAWEELGRAMPKQEARQVTSESSQVLRQLI